jgi:hypothetical protein
MSPFDHLPLITLAAACAIAALASLGFYVSRRVPNSARLASCIVTVSTTVALALVSAIGLDDMWGIARDREARTWTARERHRQRLAILLRGEADALSAIAQGLREARYFTLVADDARKAVWRDDPLSADVESHFREYFSERERLIHDVLGQDTALGRLRQAISASLSLSDAAEPYRRDLIPALVAKCGGAVARVPLMRVSASSLEVNDHARPATFAARRAYDEYQCGADVRQVARGWFDRAADLADAAVLASDAARRYAEETVLHGRCTYAPGQ